MGVNASTEGGLGDSDFDGRTEISWHTSVNIVASHGFDSRKEQGICFLVTSAPGDLDAPEAVERSQRIFSWIQSNESCKKRRAVKQPSFPGHILSRYSKCTWKFILLYQKKCVYSMGCSQLDSITVQCWFCAHTIINLPVVCKRRSNILIRWERHFAVNFVWFSQRCNWGSHQRILVKPLCVWIFLT